jgi:hypothetical protein
MTAASCASVKPEYSPDQATAAVRKTLAPSPTQLDCLKGKFTAQPDIAAVFNVGEPATADQRDGYLRAIRACIPIEDFATLVSTSAFGTGDTSSDQTSRCVRDAVVRASVAEQDRLYLYFSSPAAVDANEIAPTTKAISEACGLATATGGESNGGTTAVAPTPSTTPTTST